MTARFLLVLCLMAPAATAQQVTIPRVEAMPALPAPYFMRDWKAVARGFDSLAFNPDAAGLYLPLVRHYPAGPNYPQHGGFGLHTYVGTRSPAGNEAISALPALVGATLVGIDKRQQYGQDWVLLAEQYFNNRPAEDVYLNTPDATSGRDWWYDTMPNVFFYQLYSLYGGDVGDFRRQFSRVANRWRQALEALGGSAAPWRVPQMNYRAFALSTMQPLRDGVPEPEAAGALAWIEYMAYRQTGDPRYRVAAEWAMEFLSSRTTNPSYELQLPYGALAAARMNAELGTHYSVEKLVGWTFTEGPLRGWGSTVGTWGGYDASGLIGETSGTDYAFALNGFQQAAALVPLARYDSRFARAMGRWMVNLASASRLFYAPFLPDANQDGEAWAHLHDPQGFIPYEALRERENGLAPFATGDAVRGGWAATNLSLYSGASVGYLAALVDTTDVPGILRLDLNATDFFAPDAYTTYLYYNPYPNTQTVTLALPAGTFDLYDAVAHAYLARGVSGAVALSLPADAARVVVLVPSGLGDEVVAGRRVVGGIVVDFSAEAFLPQPRVKAFVAERGVVGKTEPVRLYCTGDGVENPAYGFEATGGTFGPGGTLGSTRVATWSAPDAGEYFLVCRVQDGQGQSARDTLAVTVLDNLPPRITSVTATPDIVEGGGSTTLVCSAEDPEGDALAYTWQPAGGVVAGSGPTVTWTAPAADGYYAPICRAHDASGAADSAAVFVTVGHLVAHLPLDGSGADESAFGSAGEVVGAAATAGVVGQALLFDGISDHVALPSTGPLNPRGAVTVALWVRPGEPPGREQFVVSHGSWQHRWKLSITPGDRLRWTVNTSAGIADLDAPAALAPDHFSHVAAVFSGEEMVLYVEGRRVASKAHTGLMAPVDFSLLLGQMLPGQTDYNFRGALDDFYLFNRALSDAEIFDLYATASPAEAGDVPSRLALGAPYPNPSGGAVEVPFSIQHAGAVRLVVYDLLGREVQRLWDAPTAPGTYRATWNGLTAGGSPAGAGVYLVVLVQGAVRHHRVVVRVP